jgi:hypothetical protein
MLISLEIRNFLLIKNISLTLLMALMHLQEKQGLVNQ